MTNFEETKKVLNNINLELPEIPDIKDMKKISQSDLANELNLLRINIHKNKISLIESNKKICKRLWIMGNYKSFRLGFWKFTKRYWKQITIFCFYKKMKESF